MLAILRWAENPRDRIAAFRILQLLPGIGPATARKALLLLEAAQAGLRGARGLRGAGRGGRAVAGPGAPDARSRGRPACGRARSAACARSTIRCSTALYEFPWARQADLDQLEQIAASHPSRERFLTELTLDPPQAAGDQAGPPHRDEDYLILSTIHSAKGQEWQAVYVLNVVDGCIPSDMATDTAEDIEEERRLLYVAMTRARDALHLIQPQRFYSHGQGRHGDRYVSAPRTRFIPDALLERFEVQRHGLAPPWQTEAAQVGHRARRYRRPDARDVALAALVPCRRVDLALVLLATLTRLLHNRLDQTSR